MELFQEQRHIFSFKVVLVLEGLKTIKLLTINLKDQTMSVLRKTSQGSEVEKVFHEAYLLQI